MTLFLSSTVRFMFHTLFNSFVISRWLLGGMIAEDSDIIVVLCALGRVGPLPHW